VSSEIKFVIIANPRTGTNHFIDLLNSHEEITCHREVFHRNSVYLYEGTRDDLLTRRNKEPLQFLEELYQSSPTRACGFKIFMNHDDVVLKNVLIDPNVKKIVLYRSMFLAVYSSDLIAATEKKYLIMEDTKDAIDSGVKDKTRTKAKAYFDPKQFEQRLRSYQYHYSNAVKIINYTNQNFLFTTYEDYVNEDLFRRVFSFLGLSQPKTVHTRMKKMNSSDILSRFDNPDDVYRYLNETARLHWLHEGFMLWSQ